MRETIELIRALLRGETVDIDGEVVAFHHGRLSFSPLRPAIPVYVAGNGPLGQRVAAEIADGVIMEACASVGEVRAFRTAVEGAAHRAGRDSQAIRIIARLDGDLRHHIRRNVGRILGQRVEVISSGVADGRRHQWRVRPVEEQACGLSNEKPTDTDLSRSWTTLNCGFRV
jgi:alkanesulfonate monooxygenase SsuD/methylene tetrahydromethanopterin reductase-like flavin-dependent oxidoreductase (luciferase family)